MQTWVQKSRLLHFYTWFRSSIPICVSAIVIFTSKTLKTRKKTFYRNKTLLVYHIRYNSLRNPAENRWIYIASNIRITSHDYYHSYQTPRRVLSLHKPESKSRQKMHFCRLFVQMCSLQDKKNTRLYRGTRKFIRFGPKTAKRSAEPRAWPFSQPN